MGVFGVEEEGGGVRSGPGEARTILLLHIISARPSKQPHMVGSTLGVYSFGLIFVSARTNKRHHHQPRMVRTFLKVYMELGSYFVSARTKKRHHHHHQSLSLSDHH